jgi:hypothetical protein
LLAIAAMCQTPSGDLFDAARTGDLAKLRRLAEEPGAAGARGPQGRTALHEAIANCQVEAAKMLVDRGWDPRAVDARGSIPAALVPLCPENIRPLLYGALVPRTLEQYPWSLQYAATHHQVSVITMLIGMGVDVNAQGSEGNRALDVACLQGDAPVARLLLEHGADPNLRNKTGSTPLHDAALNGSKEVIELLLTHKAGINAVAPADGSTPLQYAASMDRLAAVQTLVEHGADVTLKNAKGLTASQLAGKNGFSDVSEFLAGIVPSQK